MSAALKTRMLELLSAPVPSLSPDEARQIARRHYGVSGVATLLGGERDQNFHIQAADGPGFVLKVANPLEDPVVTDLQTQALAHLAERDPDLPIPRVCTSGTGATQVRIEAGCNGQCTARLLTYLPGVPVGAGSSSAGLRADLGACLARMDRAFCDLSHPGARHGLLWNMMHAASLIELVEHLPDAGHRALARRAIERFEKDVLPALSKLRSQVIYNDLNPSNVLVDAHDPQRLVGVIDFGDVVHSPLVVDVAVGAAYQLRYTPDPLEGVCQLLAAYHREMPLEEQEVDLLFDLIATRLASALTITAWHATLHPDNREYIMRNAGSHGAMLSRFEKMPRKDVQRRLRAACDQDAP